MKTSPYITRKEIADLIEVSVVTVRRKESVWGIVAHIMPGFNKPVRFERGGTIKTLKVAGLIQKNESLA